MPDTPPLLSDDARAELAELRDAAELAVMACLGLLPLKGSWDAGFEPTSTTGTLVATQEEWHEAAASIAALHRQLGEARDD